jgi:hypothetical protein
MREPKPGWFRKPQDNNVAIVFVHGVLSKDESAWRTGNTYWPELISSVQNLRDVGIYVFSYRMDVFSGSYRLSDAVDSLDAYLDLDHLIDFSKLLFVCHSTGGIVVRQFLVTRQSLLIERRIDIGLFLIASPSLGSEYANLFRGLARAFRNEQVQALRFADDNTWLNDLDHGFMNLKESGKLLMEGRELVEDDFIVLPRLFRSQVVKPFRGARYFGDSIKIAHSNHFTIATPTNSSALQHRLLVQFVQRFIGVLEETQSSDTTEDASEAPPVGELPRVRHKRLTINIIAVSIIAFACALLIFVIVHSRLQRPLFSTMIPLVIDQRREIEAIAAADLENNGKPDLVTVNFNPYHPNEPNNSIGSISVLRGLNNSGFQSAATYNAGNVPYGIVLADFNKDDIVDVAVMNIGTRQLDIPSGGTLSVFLGKGDGTLQDARDYPIGNNPTVPAVGDFNNDGIPDLAVGSWTDDIVSIFLGKGDGTFSEPHKYKASIQIACVAAGHFSSGGNLDLAVANNSRGQVQILLGAGDGTFLQARSFPTKEGPTALHSGLWWGVYSILVGDFNEDGYDDLAVTNFSDDNIGILLGDGNGGFASPRTFPTDKGPFSLAIGDFNGDGKADLVSANNSQSVSVLLGNGDGTFRPKETYRTGGSSTSIVVADFNGDGKPDLAVSNRDKNYISLFLNSMDITPTSARLYVIANSLNQGFPVTLKAVVTSKDGTPAGRVQFRVDDKILATQSLKNGEAVFSASNLRKGSHTIVVEYKGSGRYNASSASTTLSIQ